MERVRPPRSSDDAVPETIGPLPSTHSPNVLLDMVRSPGVTQEDVDELLQGLARPLAEGESARARADFLLSVIDAHDVGDLLGKGGMTVRAAAVKSLLDLGYPYALEIAPEALAEARSTRPEEAAPVRIPIPGILATLAGLLTQCAQLLPLVFDSMSRRHPPPAALILIVFCALLGPAIVSVAGGLWRIRGLLFAGLFTMGVTGAIWIGKFITQLLDYPFPFQRSLTYVSLVAGLGFLVGAFLMRPKAWLPEAEEPEDEETPANLR
jgi:hypothetical protein